MKSLHKLMQLVHDAACPGITIYTQGVVVF